MASEVVYERKEFPLDQGIALPRDARRREVDAHHVFLSTAKAAYVVTDALGAQAMELLLDGATLRGALGALTDGDGPEREENVQGTFARLLLQVEKNGFYEAAETVDDVQESAPLLSYLTKCCNLACTHCYAEAGPQAATSGELTVAEWTEVYAAYREFLDAVGLPGKITLSGGEPLVRRDFFAVAEAARRGADFLEVFTNGTLVRDARTAGRLAALADQVQVSLDGATAEVNDAIRGHGSHRKILRALRLLLEAGVRVRVAVTLMPCNADDIAEHLMGVIEEVGPNGIEVRIGLANVQGRAGSWARFRDSIEGEQVLRRVLSRLYETGLQRPRNIRPNFRNTSCGYGRSLTVAADGRVFGCAIESLPLGNVRETSLKDLALRSFGFAQATEVDRVDGCRECELRYLCNGGCRLNNFFRHGDLLKTYCTPEKKQEVLRKLVRREVSKDLSYVASEARVGGFWT